MGLWKVDRVGNGDFIHFKVTGLGINRHSIVLASICEIGAAPGQPPDFPFVGAATLEVHNIAPQDDGSADFVVAVRWGSPINYRLNIATY